MELLAHPPQFTLQAFGHLMSGGRRHPEMEVEVCRVLSRACGWVWGEGRAQKEAFTVFLCFIMFIITFITCIILVCNLRISI